MCIFTKNESVIQITRKKAANIRKINRKSKTRENHFFLWHASLRVAVVKIYK